MTIMSDKWIKKMSIEQEMITPFFEVQVKLNNNARIISYGLSSYGYDARVSSQFKIFTNINSAIVDPKNFNQHSLVDREVDVCLIPPNSFALARTVEYFKIPRDVLVVCVGKSTYARCGIIVNVTPLEPEWEGHVTLEFSNTTPLPAKIYANEGACQFLFFKGEQICDISYADRRGKYMKQRGDYSNNMDDNKQQEMPHISVNAQYIKDFSFENPNAPASLASLDRSPQIDLFLDLNIISLPEENFYEVELSIEAKARNESHKLFIIDLKYAGVFNLINIPAEQHKMILAIHCPSMIFPFARRIIADITQSGGFQPLMIDPIDFGTLYNKKLQEEGDGN
ncbi:dCTP deaminase, partial [Pseudolycoriella hygida]